MEVVEASEGSPSAFLLEATQFPCSKCGSLVYSLSKENSYFLHCKNSQEVPVRIVFYTSKEELILVVAGKKQSRKRPSPNLLGSPSHLSPWKEGWQAWHRSKVSRRQAWPCASQGHRALQRGRCDSNFLAPCCRSGASSLTGKRAW